MAGDGHYFGISYLSGWLAGNYSVFFRAMRLSMRRRGVHSNRVFIVDSHDMNDASVIDLLEQHYHLNRETEGRYEFRLCYESDLEPELRNLAPIGFIETLSANEPEGVIIDRAKPRSFSEASVEENWRLRSQFRRLWKQCLIPDIRVV